MKQDWQAGPIGDMYLERYVLGELPESGMRALEFRLAADPALRRRLEAIKSHNPAFVAALPAEEMVPRIHAAAGAAGRKSPGRAKAGSGNPSRPQSSFPARRLLDRISLEPVRRTAGAMALLALLALPVILPHDRPGSEGIRLKGKEAELRLYRRTPDGPERLRPGAKASAGDIVQAEFHPGGSAYGAIVSVDGNGSVTLHWPARPDAGTAWSSAAEFRLPEAFELDQAPAFERFHMLLSDRPIDLESLLQRVAASSRGDEGWLARQLPETYRVITFTLAKDP